MIGKAKLFFTTSLWSGLLILIAPATVYGQGARQGPGVRPDVVVPIEGLIEQFNAVGNSGTNTFSGLISQIIIILLFIIGVAAILYLLIAGFNYVTAGGDDEKAAGARKGIVNAVIGIIVVLIAWFIFRAASNVGGGLGGEDEIDIGTEL